MTPAERAALVEAITRDLRAVADPAYREGQTRYGLSAEHLLGVRVAAVRRIGRAHGAALKALTLEARLAVCETLLRTGWYEHQVIAFAWAAQAARHFTPAHFTVFERWLKAYVRAWNECDDLCGGALGACVRRYPQLWPRLRRWTRSRNRWQRRAAAVAFIAVLRPRARPSPAAIDEALALAEALLHDPDDLVQKGYGWLLKEASVTAPQRVLDFVNARRATMPRTALRYALEKLPSRQRQKVLKAK